MCQRTDGILRTLTEPTVVFKVIDEFGYGPYYSPYSHTSCSWEQTNNWSFGKIFQAKPGARVYTFDYEPGQSFRLTCAGFHVFYTREAAEEYKKEVVINSAYKHGSIDRDQLEAHYKVVEFIVWGKYLNFPEEMIVNDIENGIQTTKKIEKVGMAVEFCTIAKVVNVSKN